MIQAFFLLLAYRCFNVRAFLVRPLYPTTHHAILSSNPASVTATTVGATTKSIQLSSSSSDIQDNPDWSSIGSIKIETLDDRLKTLDDVVDNELCSSG